MSSGPRFRLPNHSWAPIREMLAKPPNPPSEEQIQSLKAGLEAFCGGILDVNTRINLTRITDPQELAAKHLFDSLFLLNLEPLGVVLDWGTGGGFPGVPLAIARKSLCISKELVICLDSRRKKVEGIKEALGSVDLPLELAWGRGEDFIQSREVDTVVARAVAPPERFVRWLDKRVGRWIIFGSSDAASQWASLDKSLKSKGFTLKQVVPYNLPSMMGARTLVILQAG